MIKEGRIVSSEVTIRLLERAILKTDNDKFLIDGFPHNEEIRAVFESVVSLIYNKILLALGFCCSMVVPRIYLLLCAAYGILRCS